MKILMEEIVEMVADFAIQIKEVTLTSGYFESVLKLGHMPH